jgi:hypothetical protein
MESGGSMSWQPIETAPKDGTKVLLQPSDHREYPFIGHWGHVGRYTTSPSMWLGHEYGAVRDCDLTHWQPLPEPPADQSSGRVL